MARKLKLNMEGVESYTRCPEGEWLAKLTKIDMGEVQGSGDDCLKARFEVIKGSAKGNTVFETFALSEKALWKLKSFLEAIGVRSTGKFTIDLDKLEGKICIIDVVHDEYNGTKRAKISAYIKPGDDSDEDEEDEVDDEEEEEEAPKKSAPAKKSYKKKPEPEEDDDEDDDEDDEEEEEKPAPKSKKSAKKAPAKKAPAKKKPEPEEDDDDEDDDWEEDDD